MEQDDREEAVIVDPYIYIWLDESIDTSKQSQDIKSCIQQVVKGRLRTFASPDECIDYMTTENIAEKIFLIVSNRLGQYVIPLIYDIPQIEKVYVFCVQKQAAEAWRKSHFKIGEIFVERQALLRRICHNVGPSSGDDDEGVPFSVFHLEEKEHSLKNLSEESTKFMWYQSIMTLLVLLANHFNSKEEMVAECQAFYHNDTNERKKINDFIEQYASDKVVWWYTRDSFVYRLLNRALRMQNLITIFKFRFFINDLHKQIQLLYREYLKNRTQRHLTVYRGQFMSMEELNVLRNNDNQIISMNSFLSTTRDRRVAEVFFDADGQSKEASSRVSVLFIIDVDQIDEQTTPFAFITRHSCNPHEDEVLFTIGTIFKVESVRQEGNVWHVHLKLTKLENQQHKEFSTYMIEQMGAKPGPVSFGWFLYRMGAFNKAECYAEYIIKQLTLDDTEIGDAYNLLGLIYKDLRRLEKSIDCYTQALDYYSRSPRSEGAQVIAIHHNIGLAYLEAGDSRLAEDHRREADQLLGNSPLARNSMLINMRKDFRARLHAVHGNYDRALKELQTTLEEKRKTMPSNHPTIATTLNLMGVVLEKMNRDNEAMKCFEEALNVSEKSLATDHFDTAEYYANIGRVYYKRRQYPLALKQFEMAVKIITDTTREENDAIVSLLKCISMTQEQIDPLPKNPVNN